MLVVIQKKLDATSCPSCGKNKVLQASLSCSRDDKRCEPICQCLDCGLILMVNLPHNARQLEDANAVSMSCDLVTASCQIEIRNVS